MRVEMTTRIGGYRNLEPWPEIGETIELPDHEAADLIAAGYAKETKGGSEAGTDDRPEAPEVDAASDEDTADTGTPTEGDADSVKPVRAHRSRK